MYATFTQANRQGISDRHVSFSLLMQSLESTRGNGNTVSTFAVVGCHMTFFHPIGFSRVQAAWMFNRST